MTSRLIIVIFFIIILLPFLSPVSVSASSGRQFEVPLASFNPQLSPLTLTSPKAQSGGEFGRSVAVSGGVAVVGAPDETASGLRFAGHAYIFNATNGGLISTLTSPNAQSGGEFGSSVAISSSVVVVGAPDENVSAGHVYIFNATTGSLINTLTSPNAQSGGGFGSSVAISQNFVVVGAVGEGASGHKIAGHAYFVNLSTGHISTLKSPNAQSDGSFGWSVAISHGIVFVGAGGENVSGLSVAGHAYTFNATTRILISTLTSPNDQSGGEFGRSVAISGSLVVVGAPRETVSGLSVAGHAYTFNAATGSLISTLTSPKAQSGGEFGISVAVSGGVAVVGAEFEKASGQAGAGHAYKFNSTTGNLISTLTSPNAGSYGYFGGSVAIGRSVVVVGAEDENVSGKLGAGHAYVF